MNNLVMRYGILTLDILLNAMFLMFLLPHVLDVAPGYLQCIGIMVIATVVIGPTVVYENLTTAKFLESRK